MQKAINASNHRDFEISMGKSGEEKVKWSLKNSLQFELARVRVAESSLNTGLRAMSLATNSKKSQSVTRIFLSILNYHRRGSSSTVICGIAETLYKKRSKNTSFKPKTRWEEMSAEKFLAVAF